MNIPYALVMRHRLQRGQRPGIRGNTYSRMNHIRRSADSRYKDCDAELQSESGFGCVVPHRRQPHVEASAPRLVGQIFENTLMC